MTWRPGPAALDPALAEVAAYRVPEEPIAIRLDANESPWPLSDRARARIAEVAASLELHRYPEIAASALRTALARRVGAAEDELVLGVGSDEAIVFLATALRRAPAGHERATVVLPTPTFSMYAASARIAGLDVVSVETLPDFALDVPAMLEAIRRTQARLCFIATPNNPTGNAQTDETLRALVRGAPDTLVVLDEAYGAYAGKSLGAWLDEHDNVALLGTLSKIGMAALRIGWVRARPALAAELEKVRLPYNLSLPAQAIATLLLGELASEIDDAVARVLTERARVIAGLASFPGLVPHPTDANFVLVDCGSAERAHALYAGLIERGIRVRSFTRPPRLTPCLRITIGTPAENDALLAGLRAPTDAPGPGGERA